MRTSYIVTLTAFLLVLFERITAQSREAASAPQAPSAAGSGDRGHGTPRPSRRPQERSGSRKDQGERQG